MRFHKATTYNRHDTSYTLDERHTIHNGVEQRCDDTVSILQRHVRDGLTLGAFDLLREGPKGKGYRTSDYYWALTRLAGVGVVVKVGHLYRLAPGGARLWDMIKRRSSR
jgi:hypothetical protein